MHNPCVEGHGHAEFVPICPLCVKCRDDPRYAIFRGESVPVKAKSGIPDCVHRGQATGETVGCKTCTGRVELKVFACAVHSQGCTVSKKVDGKACCKGCPDYAGAGA